MSLPDRLRESLRVRLLAGTLLWILATIAVAGWGLGVLIRDHVERQFRAELRIHLDQLTASLVIGRDGAPEPGPPTGPCLRLRNVALSLMPPPPQDFPP